MVALASYLKIRCGLRNPLAATPSHGFSESHTMPMAVSDRRRCDPHE